MRRIIKLGYKIFGILVILTTLFLVFIPSFKLFDFATNYLVIFTFLLLFLGLVGLWIQNKTILWTCFSCAFILAFHLKINSNTDLKLPKPNFQPTVSVAHINLSLLTDYKSIEKIVLEKEVDVISLQEYTPDWSDILETLLKEEYPFSYEKVSIDLQGKAIFSKYKLIINQDFKIGDISCPHVTFIKNDFSFDLISVYLTPPLNQNDKASFEQQLIDLGNNINSLEDPVLAFGEFNAVYWAKPILDFRKNTNLLNSRRNVELTFKMPFNHIFYSDHLECYRFEDLFDINNSIFGCVGYYQKKKIIPRLRNYK